MGRQAGLGGNSRRLIREMIMYNHEANANQQKNERYIINEDSNETWSEGVIIYHNPYAVRLYLI